MFLPIVLSIAASPITVNKLLFTKEIQQLEIQIPNEETKVVVMLASMNYTTLYSSLVSFSMQRINKKVKIRVASDIHYYSFEYFVVFVEQEGFLVTNFELQDGETTSIRIPQQFKNPVAFTFLTGYNRTDSIEIDSEIIDQELHIKMRDKPFRQSSTGTVMIINETLQNYQYLQRRMHLQIGTAFRYYNCTNCSFITGYNKIGIGQISNKISFQYEIKIDQIITSYQSSLDLGVQVIILKPVQCMPNELKMGNQCISCPDQMNQSGICKCPQTGVFFDKDACKQCGNLTNDHCIKIDSSDELDAQQLLIQLIENSILAILVILGLTAVFGFFLAYSSLLRIHVLSIIPIPPFAKKILTLVASLDKNYLSQFITRKYLMFLKYGKNLTKNPFLVKYYPIHNILVTSLPYVLIYMGIIVKILIYWLVMRIFKGRVEQNYIRNKILEESREYIQTIIVDLSAMTLAQVQLQGPYTWILLFVIFIITIAIYSSVLTVEDEAQKNQYCRRIRRIDIRRIIHSRIRILVVVFSLFYFDDWYLQMGFCFFINISVFSYQIYRFCLLKEMRIICKQSSLEVTMLYLQLIILIQKAANLQKTSKLMQWLSYIFVILLAISFVLSFVYACIDTVYEILAKLRYWGWIKQQQRIGEQNNDQAEEQEQEGQEQIVIEQVERVRGVRIVEERLGRMGSLTIVVPADEIDSGVEIRQE